MYDQDDGSYTSVVMYLYYLFDAFLSMVIVTDILLIRQKIDNLCLYCHNFFTTEEEEVYCVKFDCYGCWNAESADYDDLVEFQCNNYRFEYDPSSSADFLLPFKYITPITCLFLISFMVKAYFGQSIVPYLRVLTSTIGLNCTLYFALSSVQTYYEDYLACLKTAEDIYIGSSTSMSYAELTGYLDKCNPSFNDSVLSDSTLTKLIISLVNFFITLLLVCITVYRNYNAEKAQEKIWILVV